MPDTNPPTPAAPPSKNEGIKSRSRALRGGIAEGLTQSETGALAEDDTQLTKFHGIYQQDDRDLRPERGRKRMEPALASWPGCASPAGASRRSSGCNWRRSPASGPTAPSG